MGFNTACLILNDQVNDLARDPNAGEAILRAVLTATRAKPRDWTCGRTRHGFEALPSAHADTIQIVAIGGNSIRALGYGSWRDDDEALLRKLADQLGYRVVRKPTPPKAS